MRTGKIPIKKKNSKCQSNTDKKIVKKKKKLTSRQRKAFTKILEKQQKTQKRVEMLNELKSFELSAPLLSMMTSISQTQTIGLRKVTKEKKKHQSSKPVVENSSSDEMVVDEDEDEDVKSESSENELP